MRTTSLATNNVFSDGVAYETPTYSGDVTSGIALAMDVAVHANGAGSPTTIGDTTITPTTSPASIGATSAFIPLAKAGLAMNVTVTEASAAGFVTVWPGSNRPTASSLNVTDVGQTISNHVIIATAADGGVRLFTQTGTHFVVDISGWYV